MSPCPTDHALHLYLDGSLSPARREEVRTHLDGCGACQELVALIGRAEAPPGPWPPAQIDELRLIRLLGKGSMGEVHLAHDSALDRHVAIKFLAAPDPAGHDRLLREARASARIRHPNVISVFRVGEVKGRLYVVTEFIEGKTLADLARPLPPEQVLPIALQLARGLAAAHREHVLHRDLKLQNMMLSNDGVAKLLDFGLAKAIPDGSRTVDSATDVRLTVTGAIVGTPRYLAPELWAGEAATVQTDVYAFGTVLYELLTGTPPYEADSVGALRARVLGGPPVPLRQRRPSLPAGLGAVVEQCLARAPEDRFPTAEALVAALEDSGRPPARHRARWVAVAAAAVGLIGSAGWWWTGVLPSGDRRLAIGCQAVAPEDAFLAAATCGLARERWCAAPRPWRCDDRSPNVSVQLTLTRRPTGVEARLEAGPRGGRLSALGTDLNRIPEVLAKLDVPLTAFVGDARTALPPSEAEQESVRRYGAGSVEAWRAWVVAENGMRTVVSDATVVQTALETMLRLEPGWAHAWALRGLNDGIGSEAMKATLAQARLAVVDPARDPAGNAMLDALEAFATEDPGHAVAQLRPHFERNPRDHVLGFFLELAFYLSQQVAEAAAIARKLNEERPDLQFGADLAGYLFEVGRAEEVRQLSFDWLARAPQSPQALLLQIGLAGSAREPELVRRLTDDFLLLHGDAVQWWTPLCDAYASAGLLREAHVLADRLVAQKGLPRARGLYRSGVLAILEGRFAAAEQALLTAEREGTPYGLEFDLAQTLEALRSLQALARAEEAERATAEKLATAYANLGLQGMAASVRYDVMLKTQPCPSPEPLLEKLTRPGQRSIAERLMRRHAMKAGCQSCADVMQAGTSAVENSTESALLFGRCAAAEGQLPLAEAMLQRATLLNTNSLTNGQNQTSPFHSVLARFHLAEVLEKQGRRGEAAAAYRAFLAAWGSAEAQVPQVKTARGALARLEAAH